MTSFLWRGTSFLRTDVRYMSRRDLFASSLQFLGVGVLCLGGFFVLAWFSSLGKGPIASVPAQVAGFALAIFCGMGLLGSGYLFVRGIFRLESYDPQAVWESDVQASSREDS